MLSLFITGVDVHGDYSIVRSNILGRSFIWKNGLLVNWSRLLVLLLQLFPILLLVSTVRDCCYLEEIDEMVSSLTSFCFVHVKGSANSAAHLCARQVSPSSPSFMWHDQPPSFLFSSLQSDCNQPYEWMNESYVSKKKSSYWYARKCTVPGDSFDRYINY
jgi:hypothetical protein